MPTNQEVFDKVAVHLLRQNHQSFILGTSTCAYRGQNGDMCAIGCLIPNEDYQYCWERATPVEENLLDNSYYSDSVKSLTQYLLSKDYDINFLQQLQHIHDGNPPCYWLECLRGLAVRFNLDAAVLKAF